MVFFFLKDLRTVELRRKKLQSYLRSVIILLAQSVEELSQNPNKEKLVGAVPFFRYYYLQNCKTVMYVKNNVQFKMNLL